MAAFRQRKAQRLARVDASRKGGLDERAAPVVRLLNGRARFCTTSSCSGRLVLAQGGAAVSPARGGARPKARLSGPAEPGPGRLRRRLPLPAGPAPLPRAPLGGAAGSAEGPRPGPGPRRAGTQRGGTAEGGVRPSAVSAPAAAISGAGTRTRPMPALGLAALPGREYPQTQISRFGTTLT